MNRTIGIVLTEEEIHELLCCISRARREGDQGSYMDSAEVKLDNAAYSLAEAKNAE